MERRQVKYRTRRALQHKKKQGQVVVLVPHGYAREGERLVPVSSRQAIIREANRLYGQGHRLVEIVDYLNRKGTLTRPGKPWTPMQAKRILSAYEETFKKGTTRIGEAARRFIEAVAQFHLAMYNVVNRGFEGMKNNTPNDPLFSPEFKEVVKRLRRKDQLIDEVVSRDEDGPKQTTNKGAERHDKTETAET